MALEAALQNTQSTNNMLQSRVNWLEQVLDLFKRNDFGSQSEKTNKELQEQIGRLFDEAELIQNVEKEAAATVEVKSHVRQKKAKTSIWDHLPEGTTKELVEHYLTAENALCPKCDSPMEIIGKKEYRTLIIVPAQYKVRIDVCYTYACKECPENGNNVTVVEAPRPKQVIAGGFASPEAIAHIMTQEFVMESPLYRQEQEFHRQGLELSRQTIANWLVQSADMWLRPVYDLMHKKLLEHDVLHADESAA